MTRRIFLCYHPDPEVLPMVLGQDEREDALKFSDDGWLVYEFGRVGLIKRSTEGR